MKGRPCAGPFANGRGADMARKKLVTSHDIRKLRVVGGKKGTKRIGKVKSCVFHPTERRCIGFIVKRPDLLWMFHRKDIFVALGGFDFADGRIRVKPDAPTSGHAVCRAMGLGGISAFCGKACQS